jgi:hypothetical protein
MMEAPYGESGISERVMTPYPMLGSSLGAPRSGSILAVMTSAAYYRSEAERARAAAANSKDPETVLRWLRIAKDYHALADVMEREEQRLSGVPRRGRGSGPALPRTIPM